MEPDKDHLATHDKLKKACLLPTGWSGGPRGWVGGLNRISQPPRLSNNDLLSCMVLSALSLHLFPVEITPDVGVQRGE